MMNALKRLILISALISGFFLNAYADSFVVQQIQVNGLQHISKATVLNYLPIKPGQTFSDENSPKILQALYTTGFFSDVQISRTNGTLIVNVKERPAIGRLQITGNKGISTKKLQEALKKLNVVEGQILDDYKMKQITQGLKNQYDMLGRQHAEINVELQPQPGNVVNVLIHIVEGPVVKVTQIHIIGNEAFSERQLLKNFRLTTPGLFTLLSHRDRYSREQLEQDLDNLHNFYLNHGYLHYQVVSRDVDITPDGKIARIVITISEGPQFRIGGYRLEGPFADDSKVKKIVSALAPGQIVSRQKILETTQAIQNYLADRGYAFAQVNLNQSENLAEHTVILMLTIQAGHHEYVNEINFLGNFHTQDVALRSTLPQMEGALYSLKRVDESKRRLANLPYLKDIDVVTVPVPGRDDQVDLNYHVTEVSAGRAGVQGGYSDVEGFLFGANITEPNFMGTGKLVSLNFNRTNIQTDYQFSYNNPYYTLSGISRGFDLYYTQTTRTKKMNFDPYNMDDLGGAVNYGIPISDFDTLSLGYGYDNITLSKINQVIPPQFQPPNYAPAPPGVLQFVNTHTSPVNSFNLTTGLSHSTLDRAIFPTSGGSQGISLTAGLPILGSERRNGLNKDLSVGYYKAVFDGLWYFPLGGGFIISPHTTLGVGGGFGRNSTLPFYNNFYAGGIGTLPGYEPNSLGPKNPNNNWSALGGNVEILGGLHFIFPNFISDRIRTALILDAGNIFQTDRLQYNAAQRAINPQLQPMAYENISLSNLRVTTGLVVSWYSPLGLIDFSIATPLNKRKGAFDQTAVFGFTFGTSI